MGDLQHALGKVEKVLIEKSVLSKKFLSMLGIEEIEKKANYISIEMQKKMQHSFELSFSFDANEETLKIFEEFTSILNKTFNLGKLEFSSNSLFGGPSLYKTTSRLLIKENGQITLNSSSEWATIYFDQILSDYYMEIIVDSENGGGHIRLGMANNSHNFESFIGGSGSNSLSIYCGNYFQGLNKNYQSNVNTSKWKKGDKIGFYYEKNNCRGFYYYNGTQVAQVDGIPQNFFPALTVHCQSDFCYINKNAVIPNGKNPCKIIYI